MPRVLAAISMMCAALALIVLAGCPSDDSANMAQQIAGGGGSAGASQAPPAGGAGGAVAGGGAGTATPGGSLGTSAAPPAGGAGTKDGKPAAGGEKPGQQKPAEEPYTGPKVEVSGFKVTPPSYEFTGAGRYEISVSVVAKDQAKPGVWLIKAFDANKKKVGSMEQYIVMPVERPRRILLTNFYCMSMPSSVVFELTNKQAQEAPAGGAQAPPGGGAGGAGGGGQGGGQAVPGGSVGSGGGGTGGGGGGGKGGGEEEGGGEE